MDPAAAFAFPALYVVLEIVAKGRIALTLWRLLSTGFIHLDLLVLKVLRLVLRPQFVVGGQCHKRGVCCTQIVGDPPRFVKASVLATVWVLFHRIAHNFRVVGRGPEDQYIFSCGHLQPNGRCGIYWFRPLICRNYPVLPYFTAPAILPGCGYIAVPRAVNDMQGRAGLPVLNPYVGVHHPSPDDPEVDLEEHYHLVESLEGEQPRS